MQIGTKFGAYEVIAKLGDGGMGEVLWDWSPDGTKIATRDTVGQLRVFTVASKTWDSVGTGVFPRWLPDGRHLIAQDRGRIALVDTVAKTSRQIYAEPDRGRAIFSIALARCSASLRHECRQRSGHLDDALRRHSRSIVAGTNGPLA